MVFSVFEVIEGWKLLGTVPAQVSAANWERVRPARD